MIAGACLAAQYTWLASVVIASASVAFNYHIRQPPPVHANYQFGFTIAATKRRRINGITFKYDRAVTGAINKATLEIALDNAQKNSTLHALFPRS